MTIQNPQASRCEWCCQHGLKPFFGLFGVAAGIVTSIEASKVTGITNMALNVFSTLAPAMSCALYFPSSFVPKRIGIVSRVAALPIAVLSGVIKGIYSGQSMSLVCLPIYFLSAGILVAPNIYYGRKQARDEVEVIPHGEPIQQQT